MFRVLILAYAAVSLVCSKEPSAVTEALNISACEVNLGLKIKPQASKTFPLKKSTKFAVRRDKRRNESNFIVHLSDAGSNTLLELSFGENAMGVRIPIQFQLHDEEWSNISLFLEDAALRVLGASWDVVVTSIEGLGNVTGFRIETVPDTYLVLNECMIVPETPSKPSTPEGKNILLYTSIALNCLLILVIGGLFTYLVLDRNLANEPSVASYSEDQDSALAEAASDF
ncbi:uncharacterized protein LOC125041858 [Penaeus chinensis]|uniref:uncharacterized protein LOC125041858 n=1 Tax=Penaeus chinensis TaxID=139456 RepID=UPI001FB8494B|nr:uncharacterized protein LOC125041858 [Penaeus chinensis]